MKVTGKNYNIHNIVRFKIVKGTNILDSSLSNLDIEYKNFETDDLDTPDFTIYIGNFTPSNQDCYILDDTYYISEDYLYCKDSYKLAKWEFEMSGFENGDMIIHISNNLVGNMFLSPLIDFLISFKMNEREYPLVHGSCVSKNNQAYLFPARSGGGKTVTSLYLVEKGFDFLGDNFVVLNEDNVLSFLSPLNIFTYNLAPIIKNSLKLKTKIILSLKHLLYKMTLGYAKIFTKINVRDIFPDLIVDKSKLDSIFLLIPKEEFSIEKISKEELINHLVINQKLDSLPFLKYMLEYSYMFPDSKLATHWNRYKASLRKNIREDIPIYKIDVPQRYDADTFEDIFKVLQKEL
jgi:hypothetical protein